MSTSSPFPSVNALSAPLVERLVADADALRLSVHQEAGGARMVDAGANARGSIEAGRRIAEICLGGLG
ncbi:methenyltetrahydromethanopterin cyclohydrolase, partial [Methylobacterium trifolii]